MSHLRVKRLIYKKGVVNCRGTANNVEPYDYKEITYKCTIEELFKDLIEGQLVPTESCNDFKWSALMYDVKQKAVENQFRYFKYMLEQGPKGFYVLRFVDDDIHHGLYVKTMRKEKVTMCNDIAKCYPLSYWKARWIKQNKIGFKDCAIIKL